MYIYIHVYMYVYIHICSYIQTIFVRKFIITRINTGTCIYKYKYVCICMHICIYSDAFKTYQYV